MNNKNWKVIIALHLMLMVYSASGICSKLAAGQKFMSLPFLVFYGMVIALLGFYAICWQQIIKRIPLTTAFANKAITVVGGLVWGILFFHENVTIGKTIGMLLVVIGIVLFSLADKEETNE